MKDFAKWIGKNTFFWIFGSLFVLVRSGSYYFSDGISFFIGHGLVSFLMVLLVFFLYWEFRVKEKTDED